MASSFQRFHHILVEVSKAHQPVARKGRAGGHAKRRQNGRVGLDYAGGDDRQVICLLQAMFDALDGLLAGVPVSLGCELHEPSIELVDRRAGVGLP
jgi:hypothetical protein